MTMECPDSCEKSNLVQRYYFVCRPPGGEKTSSIWNRGSPPHGIERTERWEIRKPFEGGTLKVLDLRAKDR